MLQYLRDSFRRKTARRITKEYPAIIETLKLENEGLIEFANWDNPLVKRIEITQSQIDFFRQFISKGDLVIDIRANIGDTTVPMGLAAGKEGTTLGFDPNPYVFKIFEINASLNKDRTNIIPIPCAISASEEEFYFISSEASFANGGISPTKESIHGKFICEQKIKGVNLAEFLERDYGSQLDELSFIKIDTEGYDKEIIKSISDLVLKRKPVIVAESFGASSDEAKMELFQVINQKGYDIFYFEDFDVNAKIRKVENKEEMVEWKQTINIYATPIESPLTY
jgi:FkbM family methyltransferase